MEIESFSDLIASEKLLEGNQPPLPPRSFSQNVSDQNFEIAILFKIVQRSNGYASGVETSPRGSGPRAISYASCPLLPYKDFYWKRGYL